MNAPRSEYPESFDRGEEESLDRSFPQHSAGIRSGLENSGRLLVYQERLLLCGRKFWIPETLQDGMVRRDFSFDTLQKLGYFIFSPFKQYRRWSHYSLIIF